MKNFTDLLKDGTVYQFILVFALVAFDVIVLTQTGALEPTVTGALVGLAVGIPSNK